VAVASSLKRLLFLGALFCWLLCCCLLRRHENSTPFHISMFARDMLIYQRITNE
jgi:hypothetical protein